MTKTLEGAPAAQSIEDQDRRLDEIKAMSLEEINRELGEVAFSGTGITAPLSQEEVNIRRALMRESAIKSSPFYDNRYRGL